MNISCKMGKGTFNYRVAGVLLHDHKLLLDGDAGLVAEGYDFWNLPGGRVEMFESSSQAITREICEELGVEPRIERLLWVTECMFNMRAWDEKIHELCFYYLISLPYGSEIYTKESFTTHETVGDTTKKLSFKWVDIGMLEAVNFKPDFIRKGIHTLPSCPEHLIVNELGELH